MIYLRHAANAGVRGALANYVMEGPDGNGVPVSDRASDPLISQWWAEVERLTHVAAESGDVYALQALAIRYENDPEQRDPRRSWAYWLAANQMQVEVTGKPFLSFDRMAGAITRSLSSEEILLSEAMAGQLLKKIREKGK